MAKTKIEWTDVSWNPVTGCSPISIGCQNCYARDMARRFAGKAGYPEAPNHFKVTLHPDRLDYPMKIRKPSRIFVCSMSDLFHEDVPDDFRDQIFRVMLNCPQHTFQLLTKRPHLAYRYLTAVDERDIYLQPHIWMGATASTQVEYNGVMFWLNKIQSAAALPITTFISLEPLLEMLRIVGGYPDWIIAGAETGPKARPICLSAFRVLRDRCLELEIPFFLKQTDKHHTRELDGKVWEQFPEDNYA